MALDTEKIGLVRKIAQLKRLRKFARVPLIAKPNAGMPKIVDGKTVYDCQYMINKPLCIVCDDADILESALRVYQGRALYEGALSEEKLLPLCDKYGLII